MLTKSNEERLKESLRTIKYSTLVELREQYKFDIEMNSFYNPEQIDGTRLLLRLTEEEIETRNKSHQNTI